MNLSKKRKIAAFVTVAIMVVATVATACVLTAPIGSNSNSGLGTNDYYYNNDATTPTQTIGRPGLEIAPAAAYNTSNASVVYANLTSGNDQGYAKILYPNNIYLDKTENLTNGAYYFAYNTYQWTNNRSFVNPRDHVIAMFDNVFGYYKPNYQNANPSGDANTMHDVFGTSYGAVEYNSIGCFAASNNSQLSNTAKIEQHDLEKDKKQNHGIKVFAGTHTKNDSNNGVIVGVKVPLSGTVVDNLKNSVTADTPLSRTFQAQTGDNVKLAFSEWQGGTVSATTDMHAITSANNYSNSGSSGNFLAVDGFSSVTYANSISINITIYDKSELYNAIIKFENQAFLSSMNAGFDSAYDKGQKWIAGDGQEAYNHAKGIFTTREVTQQQINDATAALNEYIFELEKVQESEIKEVSRNYNAVALDVSTIKNMEGWSRFDTTYFDFKFATLDEDKNEVGEVAEIKDAGTYAIKVAPKKEGAKVNATSWKFCWAVDDESKRYEYLTIGTYTVNKINLDVENIVNVEKHFKNSNYTFTLASATTYDMSYDGVGVGGNNPSPNVNFPNLYEGNKATAKLSLDNTTDKSTWEESISLKDVCVKTVYYVVSSDRNYNPASGSFRVEITKATLRLIFSEISQEYGQAKMGSDDLIATGAITCVADADEDPNWASNILGDVLTLRVNYTGITHNGAQYLIVGKYDIIVSTINDGWTESVFDDVVMENNDDVYVVTQKKVKLTFTNTEDTYYNNDIGHRSKVNLDELNAQLAAVDSERNIKFNPDLTIVEGAPAIDAGTYHVNVALNNNNYTYDKDDLEGGTFTILPRPITVTLSNRDKIYAEDGNAKDAWQKYLDAYVGATGNTTGLFSVAITSGFNVNDGKNALVDPANDVFSVSVATAASDFTGNANSADPLYNGEGASDRFFKANANGYATSVVDIGNSNYAITGVGATLKVAEADIDLTAPNLTNRVYNAQDRATKIADANVQRELSGYEQINFTSLLNIKDGVIVEYKIDSPSKYATENYTTDLTLKYVGDYTISYRISAPNHNTKTGSFSTSITACTVYIDVTPITRTYGQEILTDTAENSALETALQIKYYANAEKSGDPLTFASELSFVVLGSNGRPLVATAKAPSVRNYDIDCVENDVLANYHVNYTKIDGKDSNEGAYKITPKDLNLVWEQKTTDDEGLPTGWAEDGKTFTYNGKELSVVITVDESEVVDGDNFDLLSKYVPTWDKTPINVGKYVASIDMLPNEDNRVNYRIVKSTCEFTIAQREVIVRIMNLSADFGHAHSVPIGTALPNAYSVDPGALWDYAEGVDEANKFVGEEYVLFRLHSEARHPKNGEKYVPVGDYEIVMEARTDAETGAVVSVRCANSKITTIKDGVEGDKGWNATFTIKPASISYTGRQINIDYDDANEPNKVTKEQIKGYIGGITEDTVIDSEFTIEMSDLLPSGGDTAYEDRLFSDLTAEEIEALLDAGRIETKTISDVTECGRYFVYIRISHSRTYEGISEPRANYAQYTGRIEVNIRSKWVSIILDGFVTGNYGDDTDSGDKLYEKLRGRDTENATDKVARVIAPQDPINLESKDMLSEEDALNLLEKYASEGKIRFYVGKGGNTLEEMTTNTPLGNYSIFVEVIDPSAEYQYFRFANQSNVGAYVVTKRLIEMDWGVTTETYGEHNANSAFHTYKIKNAMTGDNVRVYVTYYKKDPVTGALTRIADGDHSSMYDVGTYVARVTGVTDEENYRLPSLALDNVEWLETELTVVEKEMTIKLKNRNDLKYGDTYARRDTDTVRGVNYFLNNKLAEQADRYTIVSGGSFAYQDTVDDVFKFVLEYNLEDGFNFLHEATYKITVDKANVNPNYKIEFEDAEFTIGKAADTRVSYSQSANRSATYTGSDINLLLPNIETRIGLAGDGSAKLNTYNGGIKVSIRFHSELEESEAPYASNITVKNVGVYRFDLKVEAPDHETAYFTNYRYDVTQVKVSITMSKNSKDKIYGDTVEDMLKGETGITTLSDWLKKYCNIKLTYTGTVAGIDNDFEFIVVAKGAGESTGTVPELTPGTSNNVGEYDVYLNVSKLGGNYDYEFVGDCNLDAYVIKPRPANIVWRAGTSNTDTVVTSGNYNPVYTAERIVLSAWATDIKDGLEKELTSISGMNTNAGAGTATVTISKEGSANAWKNNYTFSGTSFNYTIQKRPATVSVTAANVDFGSDRAKLSYWTNVTDDTRFDIIGADRLARFISFSINAGTSGEYLSVNTYSLVGTCTSDNYLITWDLGAVTVNPVDIEDLEEFKSVTQSYSGSDYVVKIKDVLRSRNYYRFAGGMTWDDATVTLDNPADSTIKGVGSKSFAYTITLANHNPIGGTIKIEIDKAVIRLGVTGEMSSVYGSPVYTSGQLFNYVSLISSTIENIDLRRIIGIKVDTDSATPAADTYRLDVVYLSASYSDLYDIRFDNSSNYKGVYEVTPKPITFTWDYVATNKFVYNGYAHRVQAVFSGIIEGDDVRISTYLNASAINAGVYTAEADGLSGLQSDNYTLDDSTKTCTWEILPKEIDVVWEAGTYAYNGASHASAMQKMAKAKTSDLISGESCEISVEADDSIYAGTHTATAKSLNSNYVVSDASKNFEFTINKAVINLTWDKTPLVYNGEEQLPKATIEANQIVAGDKVNVTVTKANNDIEYKNVSANGYVANATVDNPNYELSSSSASVLFNIVAKSITFVWDENTQLTYNGQDQAPKAIAVGSVNNEEVEFTFEGMQTDVGEGYVATVVGVNNANYVLDLHSVPEALRSTTFSIGKGVNGFTEEGFTLPATMNKLPWADGVPAGLVKFGNENLVIKYYSDKELTKEVTDIAGAGEGKYWVTIHVDGTDNYDVFDQIFEVEVEGEFNVAIVILGAIASALLLVGALITVKSANKKKHEGDAK